MTSLNINLPDHLTNRLRARAIENGYETIEQYAQALLEADASKIEVVDEELSNCCWNAWTIRARILNSHPNSKNNSASRSMSVVNPAGAEHGAPHRAPTPGPGRSP